MTLSVQYLNNRGLNITDDSDAAKTAERLRPLLVNDATLKRTRQFLADLRADDYGKRETASRELARLRIPIDPLLATCW